VETVSAERESAQAKSSEDAARKRAAVEIYARNESTLRRTALRFSLCAADADDALQRGLEILLRKAPTDDPRQLIKWMQTVVKHEALAIRHERERILDGPAGRAPEVDEEDWVALLPADADGPDAQVERREAVARSREALQALKPDELRALTLLAEGYSYVEIGEITGYSRTKINRSLAEGRQRFRALMASSEDGRRCAELQPLLSAFCDGEASPAEVAQVREHLRACGHCRSTLRTYRAAPGAAAALAPALPLARSFGERVHEALAGLAERFGSGASDPVTQATGGAGGVGIATAAKVAAVCIGTAGGAAACVAGGLVPAPLDLSGEPRPHRLERRLADLPVPAVPTPKVEYAPAPVVPEPKPRPDRDRSPTAAEVQPEPPAESEPVAEPAPASGAAEYAPPAPEPTSEPAPAPRSGGGSPAGEFGP
jgi:RNA polymerase sigma factor (sigma-70 family)